MVVYISAHLYGDDIVVQDDRLPDPPDLGDQPHPLRHLLRAEVVSPLLLQLKLGHIINGSSYTALCSIGYSLGQIKPTWAKLT